MVGLEIAMDELACELDMDPLELRLRNYADPTTGHPFTSKRLRDCYLCSAECFGWGRRPMQPGSMRDGRDLVGWGMASALMTAFAGPATVRVTIDRSGEVLVEAGTQEIGIGVYTVLPQIAADVLGVEPDRVRIRLADTILPETSRLSARGASDVVAALAAAASQEDETTAHVLRHTFGTTLVRGGADLVLVAELMGHSRLETTRGYTRPTAEDRAKALELLPIDR